MLANMKVGTRLQSAFLLIVILGAIVAALGIFDMARMNEQAERAYANDLLGVSASKEANIKLVSMGRSARGVLLAASEADKKRFTGLVASNQKLLHDHLAKARPLYVSSAEKAAFSEAERALAEYEARLERLLKLGEADTPEGRQEAAAFALGPLAVAANAADDKLSEMGLLKEKAAAAGAAEAARVYRASRAIMIVLVLASLVIGVGLSVWLARNLMRQLGGEPAYAVEVAGAIARGELGDAVAIRPGDSSSLLHAMESMRQSLVRIVAEVRSGTDTIATASNQIAHGNLDLSSRTEQQASSLEETASSMEQLTGTVKQNADNARQANVLAASASDVATRGGTVVSEVVMTMASINESSRRIVDIIGVIDGIAFQTNILALNAAVEAARAGEQGRGFAVVASEVRNLAQRSAAAAKEIKLLIDDSVGKVDAGGRLVNQAGVTMGEIVQSITRVTDIMSEIASASTEQTTGIEQVNTAIGQMDNVTQQNAALVEEAAAAAGALQEQAAHLADVVSVFKLGGEAPPQAAAVARPAAHAPPAPKSAAPKSAVLTPGKAPVRIGAPVKPKRDTVAASADEWEEF